MSMADLRMSQQAVVRRVSFHPKLHEMRVIEHAEAEESEIEESAVDERDAEEVGRQNAEEDRCHYMGYFWWFKGRHGWLRALKEFFWGTLWTKTMHSVFFNVGIAIGVFFLRKWVIVPYGWQLYCGK